MGEPALKQERYTYQEYLEMAVDAQERLIFWDGEIFAMAGGTVSHATLETNLVGLLVSALRGKPCRPFVGNQRLRAPDSERAVFADALVVCGPVRTHPGDATAVTNPVIVFEVLSKSTEAFDRGDKFAYYRTFPTLRSVVFVSQKDKRVERYTRGPDDDWTLRDLGPDSVLDLSEIGVRLALQEIYEGVSLLDPEM